MTKTSNAFSVVDELDAAIQEFVAGFAPNSVGCTRDVSRTDSGRTHLFYKLIPVATNAASVVIHAEEGLDLVDLHVGDTGEYRTSWVHWNPRNSVSAEVGMAQNLPGGFIGTIYRN